MTSPASVRLICWRWTRPAGVPAPPGSPEDNALRSAIVSVARHYLQLARTRTPAQMESLIWQASSVDGADHGQSCAAFASLTLALGRAGGPAELADRGRLVSVAAAPVGRRPRPAQPGLAGRGVDAPHAQAHHRWHPLGDGYRPRPGDWVLFDGHVEV